MNEIKNCGLIALSNLVEMKNISIRTIINLAEDNGLSLVAYKVPLHELVSKDFYYFPAILHTVNHFVYIETEAQFSELSKQYDWTGNILISNKLVCSEDSGQFSWELIEDVKSINGGSWAAVAVGVGTLAYGIYSSEHDKAQAKKAEQAAGSKPLYQIPEPTLRNQTIIENKAQQGLADSTKQIYMENADRGLSASLDTLTKLGGGVNSIGDIYSNYEESQRTLALMEDQAKFANQQLLINQNNLMANENDKTWQLNILYPWMDKQKGIAEKKARANATLQSSVSTASQLFGKAASANYGKNKNGDGKGDKQVVTTTTGDDQNAMLDYQQYYDPKYEYRGATGYNTENYVMEQLGQDPNTSSGSGMYPEDDFLLKIFGQG